MSGEDKAEEEAEVILRGLTEVAARVAEFEARLAHAGEIFEGNHETEAGRAGVQAALVSMLELCYGLHLPQSSIRPLMRLVTAFENIDKGVPDELLAKRVKRGRPQVPDAHLRVRGMLSAAMEAIQIGVGKNPERAARWVSARAGNISPAIIGDTETPLFKIIMQWEEEAKAADPTAWNKLAYRAGCEQMAKTGQFGPTAGEKLIAEAERLSREIQFSSD